MKNRKITNVKIALLLISIVGLFFIPIMNSVSLVLLSGITLFFIKWSSFYEVLKNNWKYYLPTIGIFILYLSGLIYTTNFPRGIIIIEHSLSLLFLPIIVTSLHINAKDPKLLVKIINITFVVCSIILGLLNYIPDYFYPLEIIDIPRSYAAMFFCYAIIAIYSFKIKLYSKYVLHLFFAICIIATTAKAPILIFFLISIYYIINNNRATIKSLLLAMGILALFIFAITFHSETRDRFEKLIADSDYIRKRNWSNSIKAVGDNYLIGTGSGSGLAKLQEYRKSDWLEYYENYNTHSQYLEIMLVHGLLGLLFFLSCFSLPIKHAISNRNIAYLLFMFMILFEFIVEVYLARQRGVVFYSLFAALLIPINSRFNKP
jgi:O-antigen ligase